MSQAVQTAPLDDPAAPLKIWVTNQTEAGYRAGAANKEPWTYNFIHGMPQGSVFWDVGANVGSYSLMAAARGHVVIAVEPAFANFAQLQRNAILNGLNERIVCLPFALGDGSAISWFQLASLQPGAAAHVLGQPVGNVPQYFHRVGVPVMRLDALVKLFKLPPPSHLKIDVDGAERAVLTGLEKVVGGLKGIMIEMRLDQEPELVALIESWGLPMVGRFDQRGGQLIQGICYGWFARPEPEAVK